MINTFQIPCKIIYGKGCTKNVGQEAKKYGNKAMIVTGRKSSKKSGALDAVIESLKKSSIDYIVFDNVKSDPDVETVDKGSNLAVEENIEVIIALGGGSPLDAAKAMSVMATNGGSISEYEFKNPEKEGIPVIAIPTTAGTGSEVSKFVVITDEKRKIKMLIGGNTMLPKVAMLDEELTLTCPPSVTAATGMDALTHAIESYISKVSQPITDMYALSAIKLISQNLNKAVLNGSNMEARRLMILGQMFAGMAFSNASVALVHAMSRPLGAYFGVPHGLANAMLLPEVMKYNRPAVQEKFKVIAEAMGEKTDNLSVRDASFLAVKAVKDLYSELGLPYKLKDVGVKEEAISKMANDAYVNGSAKKNPRVPTLEDIINIYKKVY